MTNNKKTEYDKVMSFQFEDLPIRGRICQMSKSLNKIIFQHSYPDEISKKMQNAFEEYGPGTRSFVYRTSYIHIYIYQCKHWWAEAPLEMKATA